MKSKKVERELRKLRREVHELKQLLDREHNPTVGTMAYSPEHVPLIGFRQV